MSEHAARGRQLLLELAGIDSAILDSEYHVYRALLLAVEHAGCHVVAGMAHRFEPHGVTAMLVLSESHAVISTWPEHGVAMVDVFTCGDAVNVDDVTEYLIDELQPTSVSERVVERDTSSVEAGRRAIWRCSDGRS